MTEIPETDWAAIESALIDRHPLDPPRPPLTWRDIYMQKTGREPLYTGVVMQHSDTWHNWRVTLIKNGRVVWKCWCGRRDEKQVRVYGILPAQLLFKESWTCSGVSLLGGVSPAHLPPTGVPGKESSSSSGSTALAGTRSISLPMV